jgi:hypothetical protein
MFSGMVGAKLKILSFFAFFTRALIFRYLLRCESLEVGDYVVGFRRLASIQNLTHEYDRLKDS